jgi:hypothetical protein
MCVAGPPAFAPAGFLIGHLFRQMKYPFHNLAHPPRRNATAHDQPCAPDQKTQHYYVNNPHCADTKMRSGAVQAS